MTDIGTGEVVALRSSARATRRRLLTPHGGRESSELDILSEPLLRKARVERVLREKNADRDARRRRAVELLDFYLQAVSKWVGENDACPEPKAEMPRIINTAQIIAVVADFYEVHRITLSANNRTAKVAYARHVAVYLAREHTLLSLAQIGQKFGGRDHSTIAHARQKVIAMLAAGDSDLASEITQIRSTLGVASPCVDRLRGEGTIGSR